MVRDTHSEHSHQSCLNRIGFWDSVRWLIKFGEVYQRTKRSTDKKNRQKTVSSTVRPDQLKFNHCTVDIIDFEYCFIWHFQITAKLRSLEVEVFNLLLAAVICHQNSNFVTNIMMPLIFSTVFSRWWTSDFLSAYPLESLSFWDVSFTSKLLFWSFWKRKESFARF